MDQLSVNLKPLVSMFLAWGPIHYLYHIAKVFVCKQWRGFEFDSGWQRSVELPFEAIERGKKLYLPTRRHQLRH